MFPPLYGDSGEVKWPWQCQLYMLQHRWECEQPGCRAPHLHVLTGAPSSLDVCANACVVSGDTLSPVLLVS